MDQATPPPASGEASAPPVRRRYSLPPKTPPIQHNQDTWTAKSFAMAICGGVKGEVGRNGTDAEAVHRAYMKVLELLPTETLAGLYNHAFDNGDEGGFWQGESLAAKLLNQDG